LGISQVNAFRSVLTVKTDTFNVPRAFGLLFMFL